tara:strand:+ start:1169 stop:1504 length:336 start_codon:yes stop_codon:yes gene_type:complete
MFEDHSNNEIILHENELGSIIQCKSCEKIAITINNILYICDEKEFHSLFEMVELVDQQLEDYIFEIMNKKFVVIDTRIKKINLIFSLNQFEQLTELMNQSKYMKEVHKLFC